MPEFNHNLWAPWRMEYIRSLAGAHDDNGCFLCTYAAEPDRDDAHHVLWRGDHCFTTFNTFPYSSGHLLIAPLAHQAALDELDDATLLELMHQLRDAKKLLRHTTSAKGFNVGMNFGRCAGAGLPGHLHVHIVPRWEGDTNFMTVLGDARVISQSIADLREQMAAAVVSLGLPPLRLADRTP